METAGSGGRQQPPSWLGALVNCGLCAARKPVSIKGGQERMAADPETISLEGTFERRGLRVWDVLWNSSFAELRGRVLSVYDIDAFEGERTLLAHVVLSEEMQVRRLSLTEWELRPPTGESGFTELQFHWRSPDALAASRWVEQLQLACAAAVAAVAEEEADEGGQRGEGEDSAIDPVLMSTLLSPGMLGPILLDPSAWRVVADLWVQFAQVAMGVEEGLPPALGEPLEAKGGSEGGQARPFQRLTQEFRACLLGEADVDLSRYVEACQSLMGVSSALGAWTMPLAREVYKNAQQIRDHTQPGGEVSMHAALREEVERGAHRPGGRLAEPSAACGVLWLHRGLSFWVELLRGCVLTSTWAGLPPAALLRGSMDCAYEKVLKAYHGPVMQTAYMWGSTLLPRWEDVYHTLAPTSEMLEEDVEKWVGVVEQVRQRTSEMLTEFDLHDPRLSF